MKKVTIDVQVEKKVDNRVNNTGRPVNNKSARQVRLAKQALYAKLNKQFIQGKKFKINNESYVYHVNADDKRDNKYGHISNWDVSQVTNMKLLFYNVHITGIAPQYIKCEIHVLIHACLCMSFVDAPFYFCFVSIT